jgi:hypothetical protein
LVFAGSAVGVFQRGVTTRVVFLSFLGSDTGS